LHNNDLRLYHYLEMAAASTSGHVPHVVYHADG